MPLEVILGFLPYFFIVSYTPGPANLYSMNLGMKYGLKTYFKVYAGLFSAYVIIAIAAAFLSYQFERYIPALTKGLTFFGVCYILWLAYHIFNSGKVGNTDVHGDLTDFWSCFKIGFLLNMTNVKIMMVSCKMKLNS